MDDPLVVRGAERIEELIEDPVELAEVQLATLERAPEGLALEHLHREEDGPVLGVEPGVVDVADPGVPDLSRRAHLPQEALAAALVARDVRVEHLEGHHLLTQVVLRFVDGPHAARSDLADDPIPASDEP